MRPHRLIRMLLLPCLMLAGSLAGADDNPPRSEPPARADQKLDRQELDRQMRERSLADAKENDRLYRRMVKENPKESRAWLLLGWNTAYNISLFFEDVNERYAQVKRGIEQLVEGLGQNPTNAELYFNIGWYLQHRIGRMDDRKAFRELFRKDQEFHKFLASHVEPKAVDGPDGLPDNFLAAQRWFEKTIAVVEEHGEPKDSTALPVLLIVHSYPAVSQREHAMAIESEGHFGETAGNAWKRALKMWDDFGERESVIQGAKVRLKDSDFGRAQVNYDYWKKRCQAEQTQAVLTARQASYRVLQHQAKQPSDTTDDERTKTKQFFDEAIGAWAKVDQEHPWLVDNDSGVEGLIGRYRKRVLNGKPLPDDFPFRDVARRWPGVP